MKVTLKMPSDISSYISHDAYNNPKWHLFMEALWDIEINEGDSKHVIGHITLYVMQAHVLSIFGIFFGYGGKGRLL